MSHAFELPLTLLVAWLYPTAIPIVLDDSSCISLFNDQVIMANLLSASMLRMTYDLAENNLENQSLLSVEKPITIKTL